MKRQLSVAAIAVLHAVATGTVYGFDIIDVAKLPAGTVYPALTRLQRDGLVASAWEPVERAREERRPPRRYYRVTSTGLAALNEALARLHALRPVRSARLAPVPRG